MRQIPAVRKFRVTGGLWVSHCSWPRNEAFAVRAAYFLWTGHLRIGGSIRWAPVGRQGPGCQASFNSLVSEFLLHTNTVLEITVKI